MPRKPKDDNETKPPAGGVRKIPDFEEGDETGLDSVVLLDKVTSKKQKDGALTRDCEFVMDVAGMSGEWPGRLQSFRAAVKAAMEGGPVLNVVYHPKVPVKVGITSTANATQLPVVKDADGVLRRVKVVAKENEATIRWTIRVSKTDGLAQEFEDAQLDGVCMVDTTTVQQRLDLQPKAETLQPKAGEPAH